MARVVWRGYTAVTGRTRGYVVGSRLMKGYIVQFQIVNRTTVEHNHTASGDSRWPLRTFQLRTSLAHDVDLFAFQMAMDTSREEITHQEDTRSMLTSSCDMGKCTAPPFRSSDAVNLAFAPTL